MKSTKQMPRNRQAVIPRDVAAASTACGTDEVGDVAESVNVSVVQSPFDLDDPRTLRGLALMTTWATSGTSEIRERACNLKSTS